MDINELHGILFDMLSIIDDICKEEDVPYMLGGGTMLGAVRHHGFIPWDDDADICIWRKDYPKMRKALKEKLPPHLQLVETEDLFPTFHDFICRIQDTRYYWHTSTAEDDFYDNKQNHVCVDIFFVDYAGNTIKDVNRMALKRKIVYGLSMGHRFTMHDEKYSLMEKIQATILSGIGRLIPMSTLHKWYYCVADKYKKNPTKYCMITNDLLNYISLPYESAWFMERVNMPFESKCFPVQAGYHEKLTLQYGDYMQPPKDKGIYNQHLG
ncbi:MAG: LicD family protein [Clostridiales bacterium]|nr:LicD family protein [Clostridiales bacterium]